MEKLRKKIFSLFSVKFATRGKNPFLTSSASSCIATLTSDIGPEAWTLIREKDYPSVHTFFTNILNQIVMLHLVYSCGCVKRHLSFLIS